MGTYRHLLPPNFNPGEDGLGSRHKRYKQSASYYREPWKFSDSDIQALVRCTKLQFFDLVLTAVGAQERKSELNIFAECFLMLMRLCHQTSFEILAKQFVLQSKQVASNIFYRQIVHQWKHNCTIPTVIDSNDAINPQEINKLFEQAYERTPLFYKELLKDFEDPAGLGRTPVAINIDGIYFNCTGSEDIELQKFFIILLDQAMSSSFLI